MLVQTKVLFCGLCGNGYEEAGQLEYHLRKEHTKNEMIHYMKIKALTE